MLLRSFLQLIALALFLAVFLGIALLLAAYAGHLGQEAHELAQRGWKEATANRELIEKVFALIGAVSTLTISALGVYKTWHFAEINLPMRLEQLIDRWHAAVIRCRPRVVPDLALVESISLTVQHERSIWSRFVSFIYDPDQVALRECSSKVDRFEKELRTIEKSRSHCEAEIRTSYLELGSLLRRCNPHGGQGILDLFKKPLERDPLDLDALELSARQAYAVGLRDRARGYLVQLIEATHVSAGTRHARALRFHAEILTAGSQADRSRARIQLESAIAAANAAEHETVDVRNPELGLAFTDLAELHFQGRRFRLAQAALNEAQRYLGATERLKATQDRLRRARQGGTSDPPKPTDGSPKKEGDG